MRIETGGPFATTATAWCSAIASTSCRAAPRGYYHEYTVHTPGERTRGARRIVCGGPPRTPDACYYSDDHYQSFRRIVH